MLLVDDNQTLRTVTAAALTRSGFDVTEAGSVEEARARLTAAPPFDLLVLDIRLADGSGIDLFTAAGGTRSAPPALFISGYSSDALADLAPSERWRFISKPFSRQALLEAIDELLDRRPATA